MIPCDRKAETVQPSGKQLTRMSAHPSMRLANHDDHQAGQTGSVNAPAGGEVEQGQEQA